MSNLIELNKKETEEEKTEQLELNRLYIESLKSQIQKLTSERDTWRNEVLSSIYQSAKQQIQSELMQKVNKIKGVEELKETK